jgi:hypothetical protein
VKVKRIFAAYLFYGNNDFHRFKALNMEHFNTCGSLFLDNTAFFSGQLSFIKELPFLKSFVTVLSDCPFSIFIFPGKI